MTKSEYQQLVEFIAPRFDKIDRRFDAVDQRFDKIDRRFDAVDQRFDTIDRRFDAVDQRFDGLEERLTRVELYAEENRDLIRTVAEGVRANTEALDRFKTTVADEFAAVRAEMAQGFQSVHEALGGLDGRVRALEARIA